MIDNYWLIIDCFWLIILLLRWEGSFLYWQEGWGSAGISDCSRSKSCSIVRRFSECVFLMCNLHWSFTFILDLTCILNHFDLVCHWVMRLCTIKWCCRGLRIDWIRDWSEYFCKLLQRQFYSFVCLLLHFRV